jgi:molybdopterin synthase catalytic subunit
MHLEPLTNIIQTFQSSREVHRILVYHQAPEMTLGFCIYLFCVSAGQVSIWLEAVAKALAVMVVAGA